MEFDWAWIEAQPYPMLVGGEWIAGSSGRSFPVVSPRDGREIARVHEAGPEEVHRAVSAAREALAGWREATTVEREALLRRLAELIERDRQVLAFLEAVDAGKAISGIFHTDIPWAVDALRYYGASARHLLGQVHPMPQRGYLNFSLRQPVGVVAEILPWNGPLMTGCQKIGAILACGNTVVVKPPVDASLSLLHLGRLVVEAGFPPGVVNVVTGPGGSVGEALCRHPGVDMVSLTGSTDTGRRVLELAAGTVKRVALELGGKNPNIVFADAELAQAVPWSVLAAFANQGEICVCGSRLLLEEPIHDAFLDRFVTASAELKVGDPLEEETQVGALVSFGHRERVLGYIRTGLAEGARLLLGGGPPEDPALAGGAYLRPTILAGADNRMCISREEIFGPVVTVIPFRGQEEALELANDTPYGLAAGVWTRDLDRGLSLARSIQAGQVYVNSYFSPTMLESPSVGWKESGVGEAGMVKYTLPKSCFIRLGSAAGGSGKDADGR